MIVRDMDLIIYGGNDNNKLFQDSWVWNIEKKAWRELKDHKFDGRCAHTACYMSDDDSVLIFGGGNTDMELDGSLGRVSFPWVCLKNIWIKINVDIYPTPDMDFQPSLDQIILAVKKVRDLFECP